MFNSEIKKSGKKGILTFKGELTAQYAAGIKESLLDALSRYKALEIHFDSLVGVDLAGLQLLCAAHKSARAYGKEILLPVELPVPLFEAAAAAGFFRHTGCMPEAGDSCLWLRGKEAGEVSQ